MMIARIEARRTVKRVGYGPKWRPRAAMSLMSPPPRRRRWVRCLRITDRIRIAIDGIRPDRYCRGLTPSGSRNRRSEAAAVIIIR